MFVPLVWFAAGGALFLTELFFPVFVMCFFGLGAWAAGFASLFTDSLAVSLGVFCFVSVLSLFLLRSLLVKTFRGHSRLAAPDAGPDDGSGAPQYVGKMATVTRNIEPGAVGEIAFGGSFWRAVAEESVAEGSRVRILGSLPNEDLTFRVAIVQK